MKKENPTLTAQKAVERYVRNASHYNIDEIDLVYHRDLKVIEIHQDGSVVNLDKTDAMDFFRSKLKEDAEPLSTEMKLNYAEATETKGHVIITRRARVRDVLIKSVVSIDLVREDNRWQIIRQTVFVQPAE